MRLTMGLTQSATHHPTRAATVFENRTRTYAEGDDHVARLAAGLTAMGAKPGERIAILALNSDAYYEAYHFRREPLPLSGAGRILKMELRKSHWGNRGRAVN